MEQNVEIIHKKLKACVMHEDDLRRYKHPRPKPSDHSMREDCDQYGVLSEDFASSYKCRRCGKDYGVDQDGKSLVHHGECSFHDRWRPARLGRGVLRYSCCKNDASHPGCRKNRYHVHVNQPLLENFGGYVETQPKPDWAIREHGVFALNCATCFTVYGRELLKVVVVDHNHKVIYNRSVKPKSIVLDLDTPHTKIDTLENVTTVLADVQRDLLALFSDETILVGHSIERDLKAVKLLHRKVVDTSQLYPHPKGPPARRSLARLADEFLHRKATREHSGNKYDCAEKAIIALCLAKRKAGLPIDWWWPFSLPGWTSS